MSRADPLRPVRAALLRQASVDRDAALGQARRAADDEQARARAAAAALLREAAQAAAASAHDQLAATRAQAGREARAKVLGARRAAYEECRRQIHVAVRSLRDEPALHATLVRRARALLGSEAAITEAPAGGIRAGAGTRWLDLSLDALAEQAVERHGAAMARLWAP